MMNICYLNKELKINLPKGTEKNKSGLVSNPIARGQEVYNSTTSKHGTA
jgi:hypothetical protein